MTGKVHIEARFEDENLRLSRKLMAELFAVDVRTVSEHLQNIFKKGELQEDPVIRNFRITAADYSPNIVEAERFFAAVQNKMHYAIIGHTAADIIAEKAKKDRPHLGVTQVKSYISDFDQ